MKVLVLLALLSLPFSITTAIKLRTMTTNDNVGAGRARDICSANAKC